MVLRRRNNLARLAVRTIMRKIILHKVGVVFPRPVDTLQLLGLRLGSVDGGEVLDRFAKLFPPL